MNGVMAVIASALLLYFILTILPKFPKYDNVYYNIAMSLLLPVYIIFFIAYIRRSFKSTDE